MKGSNMAKVPPQFLAKAAGPAGKVAVAAGPKGKAVAAKPKGNPFAKKSGAKAGMPPPFMKGK